MTEAKKNNLLEFLRSSYVAQGMLLILIVNIGLLLVNPVGKVDPEASQPVRTWAWWAVKDYRNQKEPVDLVMLGSSFIMNPTWMNEAVYRQQDVDLVVDHRVRFLENTIKSKTPVDNLNCFNFGLPGAMVSDQCMILKTMCEGDKKPDIAVLCMAPRDLMDCRFNNAGLSKHFRYLANFTDSEDQSNLWNLAFNDLSGKSTDIFSNSIYFKTRAKDIQSLSAQALKNTFSPLIATLPESPLDKKSEEDRRNVFKRDEIEQGAWTAHPNTPYWYIDSSQDCRQRYKHLNNEVFENQKLWLELAIATCKERGIKPAIVHVPSSKLARQCMHEGIYQRHAELLEAVTSKHDVPYFNLDPLWNHEKEDFTDWGHMGPKGGAKMLTAIGEFIAKDEELKAALIERPDQKVAGKKGGLL